MKITGIGYTRVSTANQASEGISLECQKAKIEAYADLKDIDLIEIVEDAGISAKNMNRPGMRKILELAKAKKIQAVIIYKLDRAFRSTIDALETSKRFSKLGVSVHSICESLDTESPMGAFFFTITSALAELERRLIGQRTSAALQHLKSNSKKYNARPSYGYSVAEDGVTLIDNPEEQKTILIARELKSCGYSSRQIAATLLAQGRCNRQGKEFHNNQILRFLAA